MWEVENQFKDMRHEQADPAGAPEDVQLPEDEGDSTWEPPVCVGKPEPSAANVSKANSDDDEEWEGIRDDNVNYLSGSEGEEDGSEGGEGEWEGEGDEWEGEEDGDGFDNGEFDQDA